MPSTSTSLLTELEATCCSFSVQQLLEVCHPYPQHFLTFCDEPPIVILDHRTFLHVPSILGSIPCHIGYLLFTAVFVSSSSILLRAMYTALLAAFFFWPLMCAGGWLLPSISNSFYHLPCFPLLPTAFTTSSIHHPWFLFLGVHIFPDVLQHSSPATPANASLYCLHSPSTVRFSASSSSYFLLTLSLYSTILSSLHVYHLIFFGPIVLFSFQLFMRTSKTTVFCCVLTYSPANALQSFTLLSCCCRTISRSSSVLCRPLL